MKNKGFSLVELIVVIAIMAILVGVAVPVYSSYIKKAEIAKDKQLVNDIVHALALKDSQVNLAAGQNGVIGYVVITNDDTDSAYASTGAIHDAMVEAFGASFANELSLSYDGWTDAILMLQQVNNQDIKDYIGSVNQSTYITDVGTDKLLSDVQHCATSFGQFMSEQYAGKPADATKKLLEEFENKPEVLQMLKDAGYETEADYANVTQEVLQNITVFAVASGVKANKTDVITNFETMEYLQNTHPMTLSLSGVADWYAALEALVAYMDDPECNKAFYPGKDAEDNPTGIDLTGSADEIAISMKKAQEQIASIIGNDPALTAKYGLYYSEPDGGKSQAEKDGEAYVAIMTSVNELDDEYIKEESSIQSTNLFDGGLLNNRVDTYIAAANLADKIGTDPYLQSLLTGKESAVVVIAYANNGTLELLPMPAEVLE